MTGNKKFFAWLDGELSGVEAAEMAARVASDPALSRLAEQHRKFEARLKRSFDSIAEEAVPEELVTTIRNERAKVVVFGVARPSVKSGWRTMVPQWAAMAATLVIGVFFGTMMVPNRAGAPLVVEGDGVYAAGKLDRTLDTRLAADPADGDLRVELTFRDQSGAICRIFTQTGANGVACRKGGRWLIRGLFGASEAGVGDYRMASGIDPQLAALIDSTIAGEPFSATQERTAKQSGWQ